MPKEIPGVKIDFFGRPLCGDCDAAKAIFKKVDVGFNYRDVKAEPEARSEAERICKGLERELSVPVIVIHHRTDTVNVKIVFIEPREQGLWALETTLSAFVK